MKKLFIKFISMLVCLTVVLAFFSISANAEETIIHYNYRVTTKICNGFQNGTNSNKVNFTFYGTERTHKLTNVAKIIKGDAFERIEPIPLSLAVRISDSFMQLMSAVVRMP